MEDGRVRPTVWPETVVVDADRAVDIAVRWEGYKPWWYSRVGVVAVAVVHVVSRGKRNGEVSDAASEGVQSVSHAERVVWCGARGGTVRPPQIFS